MKFLFVMSYPGYVRNNEPTLRSLAERGHHVTLAFNQGSRDATDGLADELVAAYPSIVACDAPGRRDEWAATATFFRGCMDYLRYFDPAYANASALRERSEKRLPGVVKKTFEALRLQTSAARRGWLHRALATIESAIPTEPKIDQFIRSEKPDAVIVTPLVSFNSPQTDWVKSAKALGVPSCLAVFSWDNLTNKGHIRIVPDRLTVWNPFQADEAVRFHGVDRDKIKITGAQCFDKWFNRAPTLDRQTFLEPTGLDPSLPYILYLCSSPFVGGPHEAIFVRDFLTALRRSPDKATREVGVMIRPHPQNARIWQSIDLSDLGPVTIYPAAGANPVDKRRQDEYFHSIHFSSAVVGINTSAMVESGIIGRPVISIKDPRFAHTQEGTLHFHHLVRCGLVHVADGIDACPDLAALALKDELFDQARSHEFITSFIRPHGLNVAATPLCVEAFEEVATLKVPAWKERPARDALIRMALTPLRYPIAVLAKGRKKKGAKGSDVKWDGGRSQGGKVGG